MKSKFNKFRNCHKIKIKGMENSSDGIWKSANISTTYLQFKTQGGGVGGGGGGGCPDGSWSKSFPSTARHPVD